MNRLALGADSAQKTPQQLCDEANARMEADPNGRRDVIWVVRGGRPTIRWRDPPRGLTYGADA